MDIISHQIAIDKALKENDKETLLKLIAEYNTEDKARRIKETANH